MEFIYEKENKSFEDYSSGNVIYNIKGSTGFPVRISSELFQRGFNLIGKEKINIYDPCSGIGYLLTTLGFLHGNKINKIFASDINEEFISICKKNLGLLSESGIRKRINEIKENISLYNKDSHKSALESALRLENKIKNNIETNVFKKDIFKIENLEEKIDLIITDFPYGELIKWENGNNITKILENLKNLLNKNGVIIIIYNEKIKSSIENLKKIGSFKHGKRYIYIFQLDVKTNVS